MWAVIDKSFLHTNENLVLWVCYVSPENSIYSSISAFDEIKADIIEHLITCIMELFGKPAITVEFLYKRLNNKNHSYGSFCTKKSVALL